MALYSTLTTLNNNITPNPSVNVTGAKTITGLAIDTSSLTSDGEFRNISVNGTPGSIFSLTIEDKNGRNVLPYSNRINKIVKTAVSASNTLELNNTSGLEVGMVLLNNQRRNVKIKGISKSSKTNEDAINETSSTYITVSNYITLAADTPVVFVKEQELKEIVIPNSGSFSFVQHFPPLERFKRTLKTAASSASSLTLDYTKDLEKNMKISGTGVDGNNPIISADITSDTIVSVTPAQTIDDETELTFEMPDNRYDITIRPINALIGDSIPKYSSKDCDIMPAYSIYQYVDPVVEFIPSSALSNVTTSGTVSYTGKVNKPYSTDITISMTATKSDGNLATSRNPRFSASDSTVSDFDNTLNTTTKKVREGDCHDKDIVHLNNTTGIRTGMIVTGNNIDENKTVTVKSIVGTSVKLSEKQPIEKDDKLQFSSMHKITLHSLTAALSPNGGHSTGTCTVTGSGKITTFGVDSFKSTFSFDNFLSITE